MKRAPEPVCGVARDAVDSSFEVSKLDKTVDDIGDESSQQGCY